MLHLFYLSKPRRIQFYVLGGFFAFTLYLLHQIQPFPFSWLAGLSLALFGSVFFLIKLMDNDEKQTRYEKNGYQFLTTTEQGETVLVLTPKPGKMSPDAMILLAVFNQEGYLERQSRIKKEDVLLAQMVLTKEQIKER